MISLALGRGVKPGHRWRLDIDIDDKRVTFRLGLLTKSAAQKIQRHIDHLAECRRHGTSASEATKAWINVGDEKLVKKLADRSLCRSSTNPLVGIAIAEYIDRRKIGWSGSTENNFRQLETLLKEKFPKARLADIKVGDAKTFSSWLRAEKGLADNSARKHCQRARQFFDDALENEVISKNPFRSKEIPVSVGVAKKVYIPESVIDQTIEQLPDEKLEWKLLFAISRYIGVRMPSEIRELDCRDINWEEGTLLIRSPKTKRFAGKESRRAPLFREIYGLLRAQVDALGGEGYLLPEIRTNSNPATTAKKHVQRAGFEAWPEFWNSLRASRETDLMDSHGLRRACAWIGNNAETAMKHYALLKRKDFEDAGFKGAAKSAAEQAEIEGNRIQEL